MGLRLLLALELRRVDRDLHFVVRIVALALGVGVNSAVFRVLEETGRPELLEELCPYFGVIWPSARALSETLTELPRERITGGGND